MDAKIKGYLVIISVYELRSFNYEFDLPSGLNYEMKILKAI